jgi:hypothetical protein
MIRENYFSRFIKSKLRDTSFGIRYRTRIRLKKGKLFPKSTTLDDLFPEVPYLRIKGDYIPIPRIGIHKGLTEYNGYNILGSYYLRYKRFLDYNNIPFRVVDLTKSDWLDQCKDIDILVTSYASEPSRLNELQAKISILEMYHGVMCYPSARDLWSYEDKTRVYLLVKEFGMNHARTFISHNKEESLEFIESASYPLVSKIKTGSCSRGVELVRTKGQANKIVRQNFGLGRKALWTYSFEKDYVYFQEFIHDASYDLRVFIVGDIIAGYRRRMKGNDFRASGAGLLDRRLFPEDAIEIALNLKKKWDTTILAVDFVDTNKSQEHKIIEASISFGLDYPEYLEHEGKRVFYVKNHDSTELREGCFWVQEFILFELIKKWCNLHESSVCLKWELQ